MLKNFSGVASPARASRRRPRRAARGWLWLLSPRHQASSGQAMPSWRCTRAAARSVKNSNADSVNGPFRAASKSRSTAGRSGTEILAAPRLLAHECSYRLLKFGRSKRWGEVKIAEYGEIIDLHRIRYFDTSGQLAELIRFAIRRQVQGYDAVYLALAMSLGARLATLDGGLQSAARRTRIELA